MSEKADWPGIAASLGLHPKSDPLGDDHHTDVQLSAGDVELGHVLAWFMGSNYADISSSAADLGEFFYTKSTSADEWARVARALRVHGLKIVDDNG